MVSFCKFLVFKFGHQAKSGRPNLIGASKILGHLVLKSQSIRMFSELLLTFGSDLRDWKFLFLSTKSFCFPGNFSNRSAKDSRQRFSWKSNFESTIVDLEIAQLAKPYYNHRSLHQITRKIYMVNWKFQSEIMQILYQRISGQNIFGKARSQFLRLFSEAQKDKFSLVA